MKKTMSEVEKALKSGDMIEGEVYKITSFGAFVKLPYGRKGLLHISQISEDFIKNISEHIKIGDRIKARIVAIDGDKIDLTVKRLKDSIGSYPKNRDFKSSDFEEKLNGFLKIEMQTMRPVKPR